MQAPWRIELLGWLQAVTDGHSVTRFATHQTAALLARLALWPRRAHSREELAELLWPEVESDAARARLRQALTSLRHQLEPPGVEAGSVLIADRTHIRLNPSAISTDVADFEAAMRAGHMAKAISLYKGELLPGFYEEWILDERERLQAQFEQIDGGDFSDVPLQRESFPVDGSPSPVANAPAAAHISVIRLPLQFTRFFGRTDELTRIAKLLMEHRLVTLTGPGGAGKTRLAIEAARQQAGSYDVVFVSLSDLVSGADMERVADAVADGLRIRGAAAADARPTIERLIEALAQRATLLIFDNAEHVSVHAGRLALTLLSAVPSLRLLATSRRRLHIAGERELPVPPLSTPPQGGAGTPEEMTAAAAVQLFTDRAQTVRPDFQITARNAADVAALCRHLEGAPLAIELAAARAATLTPAQMIVHLSQRFEFLATRRTDKDARHRSLWAAISWSVELLPASLQQFWNRLAVFRGGFTPEAAAALTGESAALEALTQLRERSLISAEDTGNEMRFRMLESLREFAQLQWDHEEQQEIELRHGAFFLELALASEEALRGPDQAIWLDRLEAEHDNVRAALSLGIAREDAEFTQQLAGSIWAFWERRGQLPEARRWLDQVLELPGPRDSAARARALNRLGAVLNYTGPLDRAEAVHRETLAIYQRLGDEKGIAVIWSRLGFVASQHGDYEAATTAFTEALSLERTLGNRFNAAAAVVNLGILAQKRADYVLARQFYSEGLTLHSALDNPSGIADTLLNLAAVEMEELRWDAALPLFEQAMAAYDKLGDRWSRAYVTFGLAVIARRQDRWDDAEHLARETLDVCREVGDTSKVGDALQELGAIAKHAGDLDQSLAYIQEALTIYRELGRTTSEESCLQEIAAVQRVALD